MPRRKHRIIVDVSTDEFTTATEIVKLIREIVDANLPDEFVNVRQRPTRILKVNVKDGLLVTQAEVNWRVRNAVPGMGNTESSEAGA